MILFIDEMHTLVGAGKADGAMDASNLPPALARGELHCIGATTLDEYRKHVEKDAALARRFQPVFVSEPTVEDTISILRGLKEKYELHHGVRVTDAGAGGRCDALQSVTSPTGSCRTRRSILSTKLRRACMQVDSKPEELDELDRRIIQLRIEQEALKESDRLRRTVWDETRGRTRRTRGEVGSTALARRKSDKLGAAQKLKEQLEAARNDLAQAQRRGEYQKAGELGLWRDPDLERNLPTPRRAPLRRWSRKQSRPITWRRSSRAGPAPVDKMLEGEKDKLLRMEEELGKRVVGQKEAGARFPPAVRRRPRGPPGSEPADRLVHVPRTDGVGKTSWTKALAALPVRRRNGDGSSRHVHTWRSIRSRLIGAPPATSATREGGADGGGSSPAYQVVLFDEIEKAHPDVFNVLLQVLDDGRLTDGQGRTVDFRNVLIIMTSNLGSEFLVMQKEGEDSSAVQNEVMQVVRSHFRPEFLNPSTRSSCFTGCVGRTWARSSTSSSRGSAKLLEDRKDRPCRWMARRAVMAGGQGLRSRLWRAPAEARDPEGRAGSAGGTDPWPAMSATARMSRSLRARPASRSAARRWARRKPRTTSGGGSRDLPKGA